MENLGVDGKLLIAQLINFALFFVVFKKYIAGPFMKFLKNERHKEEEKEKGLANIKRIEDDLEKREGEMRKEVKKEADKLITEAKDDAARVRQDIIDQANKEAESIIEKAKKAADEERQGLYKELKSKSVDLSLLLVNKALSEQLPEDVQKKITDHILTNLSKEVTVN